MKKFITKLLIFASIVFAIGLCRVAMYGNYNYSYPPLSAKLNFLERNPQYKLYFIGSSKINNQIDCRIVDAENPGMKSYNLGANAGFNLENFQTLDYILQNERLRPKYIVFELQDKIDITRENLNTERSFGVFNFNNLKFALDFHAANRDFKQVLLTFYSFVLNVFHFDKGRDTSRIASGEDKFILENNGFAPLELSKPGTATKPDELKKDIDFRLKYIASDSKKYTANAALVEKLKQCAQNCKKKGITLILIIPSPAEKDVKKLYPYVRKVSAPIIDLSSTKEFPEFYKVENRWDYGHLNMKGAEINSKILGEKLNGLLK